MGTRHLVQVDLENETKIAQYGQWDGYIDAQGYIILDFLRNPNNIIKLKEKLKNVRFINEEVDKGFVDNYNENNQNKSLTAEQVSWFNNFISRDIGAEILENVKNSEDPLILLSDSSDFKEDMSCEFYYLINLDNMTLDINGYKTYDINNLPSNEEVLADFSK